jgi:hypothetical protein
VLVTMIGERSSGQVFDLAGCGFQRRAVGRVARRNQTVNDRHE